MNAEVQHAVAVTLPDGSVRNFDHPVTDELRRRAAAMTAASLLRETMWSMVSESHSSIAFDYAAYTAENLRRYEAASAVFAALR